MCRACSPGGSWVNRARIRTPARVSTSRAVPTCSPCALMNTARAAGGFSAASAAAALATKTITATRIGSSSAQLAFAGILGQSGAADEAKFPARSGHRDGRMQIDVLDGVQQPDAFGQWPLERLAPGDQPHAAGALVDHRRGHRLGQVVFARGATAVD